MRTDREWIKWIDSSGKNEPPPDYYCPDKKIMMEVMRIDNHAFENDKNKIINPTISRESKVVREIKNELNLSENVSVFANVDTELITYEDHNYRYYKKNFIRVIKKHKKKIQKYRENHEGYKLIFFLFDESSGVYGQMKNKKDGNQLIVGEMVQVQVHLHWVDQCFVEIINNLNIDYFIWYSPFKIATGNQLPKVCVYDVNNMSLDMIEYNENCMISSEI